MSAVLPWVLVSAALAALLLALVRLVLGPRQADRVVALDVVFAATVTLAAATALLSGRALYLDVAIGLTLVGFVGTVLWARMIDAAGASPGPRAAGDGDGGGGR